MTVSYWLSRKFFGEKRQESKQTVLKVSLIISAMLLFLFILFGIIDIAVKVFLQGYASIQTNAFGIMIGFIFGAVIILTLGTFSGWIAGIKNIQND